jgi:hypothetical protein
MQIRQLRKFRTHKRTLLKVSLSIALASIFVTATLAYSRPMQKRIQIRGYLQGTETDVFQGTPPDSIAVDGSIPGLATHLTEFKYNYRVTVDLSDGSATGTGELVAADGDRIVLSIAGQGDPTDAETPTLSSIVEMDTITGGTGRFAGATGSVTVRRLINLTTGFTSGSVRGTVVLPGRHADH